MPQAGHSPRPRPSGSTTLGVLSGPEQQRARSLACAKPPLGGRRDLSTPLTTSGVNYHEFLGPAPGARAVDWFTASTGEWFSESYRRPWLKLVTQYGLPQQLQSLVGIESDFVKSDAQFGLIIKLQDEGRHREALEAIQGLPRSLQNEKGILLLRIASAQRAGTREYAEAFTAFSQAFPKDPALALWAIDYHTKPTHLPRAGSVRRVRYAR